MTCALSALLAVMGGGAAMASDLRAPSIGNEIRIEVAGVISPRCAVQQSARGASFGQILDNLQGGNVATDVALDFGVDCNGPFRIELSSQNGGLLTDNTAPGFRSLVPYSASLTLDGRRRDLDCDSAEMASEVRREACRIRFPAARGFDGQGSLQLSIDRDPSPLMAGRYADQIRLRVTPLIGGDRD